MVFLVFRSFFYKKKVYNIENLQNYTGQYSMAKISVLNQSTGSNAPTVQLSAVKVVSEQSTIVTLDRASSIQLGLKPDQIASIDRIGNNALITLKNGEVITLENYFAFPNQIVLQDGTAAWQVAVTPSATGQIIVDYLPIEIEAASAGAATTALSTTGWYALGAVALGGAVALAANSDSNDNEHNNDITAPAAGTLSFTALQDTGSSSTDRITSSKNFSLQLSGQESGTRIEYQVSTDAGKTWTNTTAEQANLADGQYQFRVKVTDAAGNSSLSDVQAITVDTTAPLAGRLVINNYDDTGSSATDSISQDSSFDLNVQGQEAGARVEYQVSTDGGTTWTNTTAEQANLTDGQYQFRVKVTDVAGNSSLTEVQQVTVDSTIPVAGQLSLSNYDDTGSLTTDKLSQDNRFDLTLQSQEAGAQLEYQISTDAGTTWQTSTAQQAGLVDGQYQFRGKVTDAAGNSSLTEVQHVTVDSVSPVAGQLSLNNYDDTGSLTTDKLSQDNHFDLAVQGQEAGANVEYQVSADGGTTWTTTTAAQANLADGQYQFRVKVTDAAGNSSLSDVQAITVDKTLDVAGVVISINPVTTDNSVDLLESAQTQTITGSMTGLPADISQYVLTVTLGQQTYNAVIDPVTQQWSVEVAGSELFAASQLAAQLVLTDIAGNTATVTANQTYAVNPVPEAPANILATTTGAGLLVTGTALAGSTISIKDEDDILIASGTADESGRFSIGIVEPLILPLQGGNSLSITGTLNGYESAPSVTTVLKVPFVQVIEISESGLIQGYATPNSLIKVLDEQGQLLQEYKVTGFSSFPIFDFTDFSFKLNQPLAEGTRIQLIVTDNNGIASRPYDVVADYTAPAAASALVFDESGSTLSGTGEAGAYVALSVADANNQFPGFVGGGTIDADGKFSIVLSRPLHDGETVQVVISDQNQNASTVALVSAPDYAPVPIIGSITLTGLISGTAEAGSLISIKNAQGVEIASTIADINGQFSVQSSEALSDNQPLQISAVNNKGQSSAIGNIVVDYTPPAMATEVGFNATGSLISGKAEAGSSISIIMNDRVFANRVVVQDDGTFQFGLYEALHNGETVKVIVTDQNSNQSPALEITAPDYVLKPVISVKTGLDNLIEVNLESGNQIVIKDAQGNILPFEVVGQDNYGFKLIRVDATLTDGQTLSIYAVNARGHESKPATTVVDYMAPDAPTAAVIDGQGHIISGTAAANAWVGVLDAQNNEVGFAKADSNGQFSITLNDYYLKGQSLSVLVVDEAGNESRQVTLIAPVDSTAPQAATNLVAQPDGTTLTGQAEANSYIRVYDSNAQVVGSAYADAQGGFEVNLYHVFLKGETLSVTVFDRADNRGPSVSFTAPNDTTAPESATNLLISDKGNFITGQAEANSRIEIYNLAGNRVGYAFADQQGHFSTSLSNGPFLKGQQLTLVVTDAAGNQSAPASIVAPLDNTPPAAATNLALSGGNILTGSAEIGSQINVYDANSKLLASSGSVNGEGQFRIYLDSSYFKGQMLTVVVTDRAGNVSEAASITATPDNTAPDAASNVSFINDGSALIGYAEANSRVTVYDSQGNPVANGTVSAQGVFEIALNNYYLQGQQLSVKVFDWAGNSSSLVTLTAPLDTIAPNAPLNLALDAEGRYLIGQAEVGGKVRVYDANNNLLNSSLVYIDGTFNIYLNNVLNFKGQQLTLTVTDRAGNVSAKTVFDIPVDTTAPDAPSNLLLQSNGSKLVGQAEAFSTVWAYDADNKLIASGQADSQGKFSIYLDQFYLKGQTIKVDATDLAGNKSSQTSIVAALDNTPPKAPVDVIINESGTLISGSAEFNSTVTVYDAKGDIIATTRVYSSDGSFNASLPSAYLKGQVLTIKVADQAGNISEAVSITALIDNTAPEAVQELKFIQSEYNQLLAGYAQAYSTIKVYDATNNQVATGTTDRYGDFRIELNKLYLKGEVLQVKVVDRAGNESSIVNITAPLDTSAPDAPREIIFKELSYGQSVSGKAEAYSAIKVYDSNNIQVGSAATNSQGQFTIDLYNKFYLKGEVLTLTATDRAGNVSAKTSLTAPLDTTPPSQPANLVISADGQYLSGSAENYSTVRVYDANNKEVGSTGYVYSDGKFSIYLYGGTYLKGQQFSVTATDRAGNVSAASVVTAPLDNIAPNQPTNLVISADGQSLTGIAEAYTTVRVYDANNKEVGSSSVYDNNGTFSIYLYGGTYLKGQQLTATATDRAGNVSTTASITAPLDTIAPDAPSQPLFGAIYYGQTLSGKAEAYSTVKVYDSNNIQVGYGSANAQGNYRIDLYKSYLKGEVLTLTATDHAGNVSAASTVIAPVDTTAPNQVTNLVISEDGRYLSGNAEAYTTVRIYDANNKEVGSSSVYENNGNFSIYLYGDTYLKGQQLTVTVTDRAGNVSAATSITAPIDNIAPDAPSQTVFGVGYYGQSLSGKAEAYSTIRVYDSNNIQVGGSSADGQGNFSIDLYKSYLKGEVLTLSATDRAGNVSSSVAITAPVDNTPPAQPTDLIFSDTGGSLSGKTEAYATVRVYDANNKEVGSQSTYLNEQFFVSLNSSYLKGQQLTVTVTDRAGNVSDPVSITAPLDNVAPSQPTNLVISADGQYLSGSAENYSTVRVYDANNKEVGSTGYIYSDGQFSIYLYGGPYLKGQQLTVAVTDRAGNVSDPISITAINDNTAPNAPTEITVRDYSDFQSISGRAEPGSTIRLYDADNYQVDATIANDQGNFIVDLYGSYTEGGRFTLTATDRAGNVSSSATVDVALNYIPPSEPTDLVFTDGQQWQILSGRADAYSSVEAVAANGVSFTGYTDAQGNFVIDLYDFFGKGEVFSVIAYDRAGHASTKVNVVAPLDVTAPTAPTDIVLQDDIWLDGQAEANSSIRLIDKDGTLINSENSDFADTDGHFSVYFDAELYAGQTITVVAVDRAGNVSESTAVPLTDNSTVSQQQSASRLYSILSDIDRIDSSADDSTDTASDINLDELFSQQSESAPNDIFAALGISTDSSQPASSPEFIVLTLTERPDDLLTQQTVLF